MKPRYFEAAPTGSVSIASGADRLLPWDTPTVNTAGFTESTDVFTCTIPGLYLCNFLVNFSSGSGTLILDIYKNGSTYNQIRTSKSSSGFVSGSGLQFWIELAIGDTIAFYASLSSTTNTVSNSIYKLTMELL